jgi:hypothetical protein
MQRIIHKCTEGEVHKRAKNCHVVYPSGKPMTAHLLRC